MYIVAQKWQSEAMPSSYSQQVAQLQDNPTVSWRCMGAGVGTVSRVGCCYSRKFGMTKFEKTPRELVSPAIQKVERILCLLYL